MDGAVRDGVQDGAPRSARRDVGVVVAFALGYAVALELGLQTVIDGSQIALVSPAAGVSVLWLLARARRPHPWLDVALIAAITTTAGLVSGSPALRALLGGTANALQALVCVAILARRCPEIWAGRAHRPITRVEEMWWLVTAASVAAAVTSPVVAAGVASSGAGWSWNLVLLWCARNAVGILTVVCLGLVVGDWSRRRRAREGAVEERADVAPPSHTGELVAAAVLTPLLYVIWFIGLDVIGLVFPLIAMTVWAGARQSTRYVVLHNSAVAATAVTLTVLGAGPFLTLSTPTTQVAVAQLYVGLVSLIGLSLALARDERLRLAREFAAARDDAQSQAALLSTIVETMAEGVRVVDADGRVLVRNPAATRLLMGVAGVDVPDEADLDGLLRLDGSPLPRAELPFRRALAGHDVRDLDLLVRTPGAPTPRVVTFTTARLPDTSGGGVVTVLRDVTAERDELRRAAQVQASLLPARPPVVPGYELAARFVPAGSVGGDFYDWQLADDGVVVTLADVMGKGVGAAILAATMRSVLHTDAGEPADVVTSVVSAERALSADLASTGAFVTAFRAHLTPGTGVLAYADAGHGLTLVVRPDGTGVRLPATGMPLGVDPDAARTAGTVRLGPGDLLLTFSDGILDAIGGAISDLDRIRAAVRATRTAQEAVDAVVALAAQAGQQPDDLTVVALRRTGRAAA
ncbi:SpoIIE family protein phosphatase [Cellulomonas gilvus]|uniref:Putative PAS/PAC sensor protein n=1 Tax=Cellulomonas gilvus (strain ATCC 13127 / NRRL B-14078) TaxID=593907 RepID=F8A0B5_CELGA|nr:SpoIIE family protein phosphatase [Cellulomonas gilvus]AEI11459.1 putative PAS/PAC sensor protein [Cellulomonas gilvus ATCC 13127]